MQRLSQDLRYAIRNFIKQPGFYLIAIVTLALGIGANTALFSVVDAVLLKKLPVKDPDQLVLFNSASGREFNPGGHTGNLDLDPGTGRFTRSSLPYQTFVRLREKRGTLTDVVAFGSVPMNVNAQGQVEVATGQAVSGNYFDVLGVPAYLGRTIQETDDQAGATPVAVLSHRYWSTRFGGDRNLVGQQINLNNIAFTVAGVAPQGFAGTMQVGSSQDIYIPLVWEQQIRGEGSAMKRAAWWLRVMGRMKPDTTIEQARASLEPAFQQSVIEHRAILEAQTREEGAGPLPVLEPKNYPHLGAFAGAQGEMTMRRFYEQPLRLLLGVVLLVLVIACANVGNLMLVRASAREREIAVRFAMGASRWRVVRQLLTESVLVATLGGAIGVLFALWIKDSLLIVSDWSGAAMKGLDPRLDLRVLAFTVGLSLLTGVIFGLIPALKASSINLTPALKDSGRSSTLATRSWLTRSLVVVQVSVSVVLLIGAGLFVRTLLNLQRVDAGFNEQNLLLFTIEPGLIGYKDERLATLYKQISQRIEAVPGVRAATFSQNALLSLSAHNGTFFLPGTKPGSDGRIPPAGELYIHEVRENFLETMQIPLLMGRQLTPQDDANAPKVAIINETFAKKFFPNESPIGKRFGVSRRSPDEFEVVGLAKDAKYTTQRDDVPPTAYRPWQQELDSFTTATFEVRTANDPKAAVSAVRAAVREVDPNLPLNEIKTQIEQADETLAMERLFAKLLSLFGLLAQQLASIGLYGVIAWSVSQRTHEIGIRMALGAEQGQVLGLVMRRGVLLAVIGIGAGVAGAAAGARYLQSLLFGIEPHDPLTIGAVAVTFVVV
ncbi:MAG TPA: ABC transporter permease, partial [Pyrinomonadaceae bacterium]